MSRRWTAEEKTYLEERWGSISVSHICKHLNRTESAVKEKVYKMKLGAFRDNGEYISFAEFWKALGNKNRISNPQRKSLIAKGMPLRKKKINKRFIYVIYIDEFWKWAESNRDAINFSKMEENIFGKEPEWLKEWRKSNRKPKRSCQTWTRDEEKQLEFYLKRDYSIEEIAPLLHRSTYSIANKKERLDLKSNRRCIKWSKEEKKKLEHLVQKGCSYEVINKEMGRTVFSIKAKVLELTGTSSIEKARKILEESEKMA